MYRFVVSFHLADEAARKSFLDVLGATGQMTPLGGNAFALGQAQEKFAYVDLIQKDIYGWVKNHSARKGDFITVLTPVVDGGQPFILVENYL